MDFAIRNSAGGIGDAVCAAYVAAGLKKRNPNSRIILFTHHPSWLIDVDGIEVRPDAMHSSHKGEIHDVNKDYGGQLGRMTTRKDWYCSAIPTEVSPEPPIMKRRYSPSRSRNEIVIAPFSHWHSRDWPIEKWLVIEDRLINVHGKRVVIVGTTADKDGKRFDYSYFKGDLLVDAPAEKVIQAMLRSQCVLGNDSGIPHVSGMYGIPTIAITAQINPRRLFSHTSVAGVMPEIDCVDCGFGHRTPTMTMCSKMCSALHLLGAAKVESVILSKLKVLDSLIISGVHV